MSFRALSVVLVSVNDPGLERELAAVINVPSSECLRTIVINYGEAALKVDETCTENALAHSRLKHYVSVQSISVNM